MIKVSSYGSFRDTTNFLRRMQAKSYLEVLHKYGAVGVAALRAATPEESGATAQAWSYDIVERPGYYSIKWLNTHTEDPGHIPVAVLIQYGHGTRSGAFVHGLDYINPAMHPIFEQIASDVWKEVTK